MWELFLLLLVTTVSNQTPLKGRTQCGYVGCPETSADVLNVHIVPHTHDDVGWLKTVDQYYYGSRNNIQKAGVQYILDSVVKELWEDPKRRFIYVETAFFWKWWTRQTEAVKQKVHTLVSEGRLQFVGGAWSMNDEAATHYQSTIDQFTYGLSKLNQTFGPCALPKVGWQIDPFGHSREFASNLAQMGYDGLFLGRIDYQDKMNRKLHKEMEMIWRGDDDLGESSDIFTGILYNTYSPPAGFCFDVLCNDEPIIDDPDSPLYNVDKRVNEFIDVCRNMSSSYKTNNILVTMGEDFQYQDAAMWYHNLDKLIQYTNLKAAKDGLDLKLFYSTPNCYLKAVKDANPTLPTKQDDFFPYASDPNAYWTGYFSSRPTTKYFERLGNSYLQMAKQIQVWAGLEEHNMFVLNELKSAMGVMQHHDAITGTEKQHVAHDYERILSQAVDDSLLIARQAFNNLMQADPLKPELFDFQRCRLNESSCSISEGNEKFVVTLYNPLGWTLKGTPVRIPIHGGHYEYTVTAPNGEPIESQLVELPAYVINIPTRESTATHELVFIAKKVKPLGYKSFYVERKEINRNARDTYLNINDYWKDTRERNDMRNIEQEFKDIGKAPDSNRRPVVNSDVDVDAAGNENYKNNDANNLNILKDKGEVYDEGISELEKFLKEARRRVYGTTSSDKRDFEKDSGYWVLSGNELSMLSDDPMIVERQDEVEELYSDDRIRIHINHTSGDKGVTPLNGPHTYMSFYYYPGCVGNNEEYVNRSSGAYIFRPNATEPIRILTETNNVVKGAVVNEISSKSNYVASNIQIYPDLDSFDIAWSVGPIPVDDKIGKEVVFRFETDVANEAVFYTDSNGRQVLKRRRNERPQYNVTLAEPVAGNYYPITNEIFIEDEENSFKVFTDRSQGGASLGNRNLEIMLHRRLLHDDAFGVGEALNETANGYGLVAMGKFREPYYLTKDVVRTKQILLELHLEPQILLANANDVNLSDWLKLKNCYGPLKGDLPAGIHLLTLEPWGAKKLLLRLENYLEAANMNGTAIDVDVANMFNNLEVKFLRETTLAANQWKADTEKWTWNTENEFLDTFNDSYGDMSAKTAAKHNGKIEDDGFIVKLKAKQIRTFIVDYELNNF